MTDIIIHRSVIADLTKQLSFIAYTLSSAAKHIASHYMPCLRRDNSSDLGCDVNTNYDQLSMSSCDRVLDIRTSGIL